jgi:hypothetical protein
VLRTDAIGGLPALGSPRGRTDDEAPRQDDEHHPPPLLALADLGFYVWGLAMSVFTPRPADEELERKTYRLRETRGF